MLVANRLSLIWLKRVPAGPVKADTFCLFAAESRQYSGTSPEFLNVLSTADRTLASVMATAVPLSVRAVVPLPKLIALPAAVTPVGFAPAGAPPLLNTGFAVR